MTAIAKPEVGTRLTARAAMDMRSAEVSQALANVQGRDLAELSDEEFEEGLRRMQLRRERMERIFKELLRDGTDYGIPKRPDGSPAFDKPMLLRSGAEQIRGVIRVTCRPMAPHDWVERDDELAVVVHLGAFDMVGRLLAETSAACSSLEAKYGRSGAPGETTFKNPRELRHALVHMAEIRGKRSLSLEISGATGFFANPDEMEAALEDKPLAPWTDEEQVRVFDAARAKGLGKNALATLIRTTLGRSKPGRGEDVSRLLTAIAAWTPGAEAPKAVGVPPCPKCGGAMWDNRGKKSKPTSPDFKCKNKDCKDEKGFTTALWEKDVVAAAKKAAADELPKGAPTRDDLEQPPPGLRTSEEDLALDAHLAAEELRRNGGAT